MGWILFEEDPPMRREQFVRIAETDSVMEAELLVAELQQFGIQGISISAGIVYIIQRGTVWVHETQRDHALQILREMKDEMNPPDLEEMS
jgi:hypothetical protein